MLFFLKVKRFLRNKENQFMISFVSPLISWEYVFLTMLK